MEGLLISAPNGAHPVVLRDFRQTSLVLSGIRKPGLVVSGVQGPKGSKGPPGDSSAATGRAVVPFAFGDASPVAIFSPAANCTDVLARIVIDTPFDGAGAALKLGTSGDPEALIAAAHVDPTQAAGYEAAPDVPLAIGEQVYLTITPGSGATAGAGRVIFDAVSN